jgi:glyoxylase-like metal-dependent hydrolase (beta-lactamase superfamily II)/ferredoxin
MAKVANRRTENVAGEFYVDSTCIDCDTCRWMAPDIFQEAGAMSAVHQQPQNEKERLVALQALLSCPTASIGTLTPPPDIRQAQASLPRLVADNVYHCGYHSERSFGAASYLIQHPDGNILVDSPRFTPPLVERIEAMGGIRYLYLTHRDDVADHQKFRDRFGCDRILHEDDVVADTQGVEIQLRGQEDVQLLPDVTIIPVPGHSQGHTVLLYANQFLFTGDHLMYSKELGHLSAFRDFSWYSWPEQFKSLQKLTNYQFSWVLAGHGRSWQATNAAAMQESLAQCLAWAAT